MPYNTMKCRARGEHDFVSYSSHLHICCNKLPHDLDRLYQCNLQALDNLRPSLNILHKTDSRHLFCRI